MSGEPMPAGDVKPHDHIEGGGTVLWVMSPLRPDVTPLLPNGGTLITFTDRRQVGVPSDLLLSVYRLEPSDIQPCPARNGRNIGCVYREDHDVTVFPHRFE